MQTTCPECRTTFRVSQDHLGARRGLVRCGHCNAVFNAYDTLLPELESPPVDGALETANANTHTNDNTHVEARSPETAEPAKPKFDVAEPAAIAADDDAEDGRSESVEGRLFEVASLRSTGSGGLKAYAALAEASDDVDPSAPLDTVALTVQKPQSDILFEPMWPKTARPPRTWKFWFYAFLAFLLVGLLVLQMAYFLRAELVAAAPATRPALERLCQPLNCVVPLPRQLTQDAIVASSLEHDPEQKSRVRLTFLLTNRTGQTQTWPSMTLTLSDMREAPVARQIFKPAVYLPKDIKIPAGMAPGIEREVRLDLDIGNLVASGYTLNLTYP